MHELHDIRTVQMEFLCQKMVIVNKQFSAEFRRLISSVYVQ